MVSFAPWAVAVAVALGCSRVEEPAVDRPPPPLPSSPVPSARAPEPALLAPTQLLSLASSPYQATLFADDEAIELLTGNAAYRFVPGGEPVSRALDLGFAATVTRQNYVYWSEGAIWSATRRAPKANTPKKLAALAEQPQHFVADLASDDFAWLVHAADDRYAIDKLENKRVKRLYGSPGSIDALTLIGDTLYFVERPSAEGWRIGRVKLAGGDATFTASKSGRWPSALSRYKEDVLYYDGARRNVALLSFDLQRERTLQTDFICSPFVAAANVYCGAMQGIFELTDNEKPRQLVAVSRSVIANLAINGERLAFITDIGAPGQDQLALNVVSLAKPTGGAPD